MRALFDLRARGETDHEICDGGPTGTVADIRCPALVIGVTSDLLFPVWQQRELARMPGEGQGGVTYLELDAPYGHDTFLIERDAVGEALKAHLEG